jgi:heat shock protein HslJ
METEDALRVAFERHYEGLFRVALLMSGSAQEAEDVVQESFIRVREKLAQLSDEEVRPYLRATVVNEWRSRARRQRRFVARLPLLSPSRVDVTPYEDRDELGSSYSDCHQGSGLASSFASTRSCRWSRSRMYWGARLAPSRASCIGGSHEYGSGAAMPIEDDLRDSLARAASSVQPPAHAWGRMADRQARQPKTPGRNRLSAAILAGAVALGGFLLLVRAFGSSDPNEPGKSVPGPAALEGTAWILTEIDGQHVTPERPITLRFDGGEFGAESECNLNGGRYEIDGATLITAGRSVTEVGCQGVEATRERLLFEVVGSSPTLELGGATLTLVGEAGTLGFVTDPCSLLTDAEVETATGDHVVSSGLVPPERMLVSGGPQLCSYEIPGPYASVVVHIVPATLAEFHALRDRNPESNITIPVAGIGEDAYIEGMNSIYVFEGDHYFGIGLQHGAGTAGIEGVLKDLARAAAIYSAVGSGTSP